MSNLAMGVTVTGPTQAELIVSPQRSYQATVTGTGAVSATVVIQVTNDNAVNWLDLGTITLSGTNSATDGFGCLVDWKFVRANVTAISGTGATVNVFVGQ